DEATTLDLRACFSLLQSSRGAGISEEEARVLYSAGEDLATRKGDLRALAYLKTTYTGFLAGYGFPGEALRHCGGALALAERLQAPWLKLATPLGLLRALLWKGPVQRGLSVAEAGLEVSDAELERTPPSAGTPPYGWFRAVLSFYKGVFLCLLGRPKKA